MYIYIKIKHKKFDSHDTYKIIPKNFYHHPNIF